MNAIIVAVLLIASIVRQSDCDYWSDRATLIRAEERSAIGGRIELNNDEKRVNDILMKHKLEEWNRGFEDPATFATAKHFFTAKKMIERTKVFELLQKLPKGASLHSHDIAMVSQEYLLNITYRDHLYLCKKSQTDPNFQLRFLNSSETFAQYNDMKCQSVRNLRENDEGFDDVLRRHVSLIVDDPDEAYPNVNVAWQKFTQLFLTVNPMVTYKPVFEDYMYQVLQEFHDDNVMHVEIRTTFPPIYDLTNRTYSLFDVMAIYQAVIEKFKRNHPKFHDAKIIYAPLRRVDNQTMLNYIRTVKELQIKFPSLLAGFDLVGQEDLGLPLSFFIDELLALDDRIKFFFHAGETKWYGSTSDENLIDAVLLKTQRIGHGFALLKHPEALKLVQQRGIAIEVSPISNQVLKLVDDLRNHPASVFIASGLPVVICNDDPGFWGAKALTYDWYVAFMGLADRDADLRFLKQLAMNSISYSSTDADEKQVLLQKWTVLWNEFIGKTLVRHYNYYKADIH